MFVFILLLSSTSITVSSIFFFVGEDFFFSAVDFWDSAESLRLRGVRFLVAVVAAGACWSMEFDLDARPGLPSRAAGACSSTEFDRDVRPDLRGAGLLAIASTPTAEGA